MLRIGAIESPLPIASRISTRKIDIPSDFFFTCAKGVVRANRTIRSECWTRETHTFCPLITYRFSFLVAVVLILVVSVPVVGSVTAIAWRRNSPLAIFGRYLRFWACDPCRSSVAMLYIWPWQAPEFPPQ